jgi:hypothetical protein
MVGDSGATHPEGLCAPQEAHQPGRGARESEGRLMLAWMIGGILYLWFGERLGSALMETGEG